MPLFQIKHRFSLKVLFEKDCESMKMCVEMAVKARADLSGADLSDANLPGADLSDADLYRADLSRADLSGANLYRANLSGADLSDADLSRANLYRANLYRADLSDANLYRADLSRANLYRADLSGAKRLPHFSICPEEGGFYAWKKTNKGVIKIYIPADAKRTSNLISRKCRADKIKVISGDGCGGMSPTYGYHLTYNKGETVKAHDGFSDDIRLDCAPGIHFFMTKCEAEEW